MAFIETLLREMTLEEKIGQLTMAAGGDVVHSDPVKDAELLGELRAGRAGSLVGAHGVATTTRLQRVALEETRLRIPLIFGFDVLHGYRSIFPVPLAEAAAFDPDLWQRTARMAAYETQGGRRHADVCADARRHARSALGAHRRGARRGSLARGANRAGEGARLSGAGHRPAPDSLAACAKHIGAYGAVTAGRDYASVDVSERQLNEVYLPPFRAAIEAGVAVVMPSFNDLAGVPTTANAALLRDTVRKRWGFDGVMVSDFNAVIELVKHGVAEDVAQAAALALQAGVDIDMVSNAYTRGLPVALERGDVTIEMIDQAVRRVLTLKVKLGLFEHPFPPEADAAEREARLVAGRALAREAATKSAMLLKNEGAVLPLKPQQRVALDRPGGRGGRPARRLGRRRKGGQGGERARGLGRDAAVRCVVDRQGRRSRGRRHERHRRGGADRARRRRGRALARRAGRLAPGRRRAAPSPS